MRCSRYDNMNPSFANTDAWINPMKAPEVNFDSIGSSSRLSLNSTRALVG